MSHRQVLQTIATTFGLLGCGGGHEAVQVTLPVVVDGSGITPATNELGWSVNVSGFRVALRDLEFTIEGEAHASLGRRFLQLLEPAAYAHPGHYAGGAVTGELAGEFLVDWKQGSGALLGDAQLLEGDYHGLNFTFRRASAADGLAESDPLMGHTAVIEGTATRDTRSIEFRAILDEEEGTQMVGGVFNLRVDTTTTATLAIQALTAYPALSETIFRQVDFGVLDGDADGHVEIAPGDAAANILRRTLQIHDYYAVTTAGGQR